MVLLDAGVQRLEPPLGIRAAHDLNGGEHRADERRHRRQDVDTHEDEHLTHAPDQRVLLLLEQADRSQRHQIVVNLRAQSKSLLYIYWHSTHSNQITQYM